MSTLGQWIIALGFALVACSSDSSSASYCQTSLPSGSYSQSCTDCTMSGTTLQCKCNGGPNGPQAASLDTCSCDTNANDLNNNQGVLKCGPGKGGGSSSGSSEPKCKTSGNSCSSSSECCGLCNMNSKSASYHTCN